MNNNINKTDKEFIEGIDDRDEDSSLGDYPIDTLF